MPTKVEQQMQENEIHLAIYKLWVWLQLHDKYMYMYNLQFLSYM